MVGLRKMLMEEQFRLEQIFRKTDEQLSHAPSGRLRLSNCCGNVQFYLCNKEYEKDGKYIKQSEHDIIRPLAQKAYAEKVRRLAEKRLSQIRRITRDYDDREIEKLYLSLHPERKKVVEPIEKTWEQQIEEWIKKEYSGKEFQEGTPVILTERGERVRSKSEKIMADYFYHHNIPYKYECPLSLKGLGIVYPDFTFLSPITRKILYWEHHGRMDDPVYARKAIKKIESYEKNGIYMGESLIVTFETSESILNTEIIESQVQRFLTAIV